MTPFMKPIEGWARQVVAYSRVGETVRWTHSHSSSAPDLAHSQGLLEQLARTCVIECCQADPVDWVFRVT